MTFTRPRASAGGATNRTHMKSEQAKQHLWRHKEDADQFEPIHSVVHYDEAVEAVKLAELDARARAVSAYKGTCGFYENGKCSGAFASEDGDCELGCGGGSKFIQEL